MHLLSSAGIAGGERHVLDLIRFSSGSFEHFIMLPYAGPFAATLRREGLNYDVADLRTRFSPSAVLRLAKEIRRKRIDILHTHGYRANFFGGLAGWASPPAMIATVHVSLWDYRDTPPPVRVVYLALQRLIALRTARLLCVSDAMRRDMQRLGIPKHKLVTIHNGVQLDRFTRHPEARAAARRRLKLDTGPVIGTVGRMVSEKGQTHLISALARLKPKWPDIKCLFIGDGPLRPLLMNRAHDAGLSGACQFTGKLTDIESVYPALDVFALPSLREPFGLVLIEAMASEVPVIATAAGGPLEIIENGRNGFLVPPGDSRGLAEAIDRLLKDRDLASAMAVRGRQTTAVRFDIRRTVKQIEAIYTAC